MKVRQDAWSHEDDLLLAETVLRYIREGGTQLAAFDEAGDTLNRTSAACGFRWNAEVRRRYTEAISLAKKQRKERKRMLDRQKKEAVQSSAPPIESLRKKPEQPTIQENTPDLTTPFSTIGLGDVITFLSELKTNTAQSHNLIKENEALRFANKELAIQKEQLEAKLASLQKQQAIVQEDYRTLLAIMQRAERIVSLEDDEPLPFLPDETDEALIIQT